MHGIEDPPVHWLQTITHIWEGAVGNNRHGIVDEALLHLGSDRSIDDAFGIIGHIGLELRSSYFRNYLAHQPR